LGLEPPELSNDESFPIERRVVSVPSLMGKRENIGTNSGDRRCPICGEGVLSDLMFDAAGDEELRQMSDSHELTVFSCGHEVLGPPLDGADQRALDVERRSSDESAAPVHERKPRTERRPR